MKKVFMFGVALILLAACSSQENRLFKQAQLQTEKGNLTKAIQLYSSVIKQNPKNYAALANRGILYERLKAKDAKEKAKNKQWAERDYLAAVEANPNVPATYNNLGALYIDEKRYDEAVYYLTRALSLYPNYFTARLNRAIANHQQGRVSESLADFSQAFLLKQDSPLLYLNRGLAYFDAGDYESAASDYSDLMVLEPENPRAYLERGRALMKMGYMGDAQADFETAALLKPTYGLAYYYLGELAFMEGEVDDALGYLKKTKELSGQFVPAYELMGDMLALEDPVEATKNYLVARKLDPANAGKYERKIQLMKTEAGRKYVISNRFLKN